LVLLCASPLAAAEEAAAGGYRVDIPVAGLQARLDTANSGSTVDLLALADGKYTLAMSPLRMGGERYVRAVLMQGSGFFGLCLLGKASAFAGVKSLCVEIELLPESALLRFSALPGGQFLAAMELAVDLAGEYRLLPVGQTQGVTVTAVEAPPPSDGPAAQPADATASPQDGLDGPEALKLHPGIYALALLITAILLAALVLGKLHWRRIKRLGLGLWAGIDTHSRALLEKINEKREKPPVPKEEAPEAPGEAVEPLPGLRVTDTRGDALVRQITMRTAWEAAAEEKPTLESYVTQMNGFFLGRAPLPGGGKFLTVGLRNRDALQQLGGGSVRPLFAPNPKGQIFSLEEESGGLYLHADYFAPPSFVLQSVLRSVCLECVFFLEDAQGEPLRLENVLGHSILGIVPALTARTEAGYILTRKGTLVIGEN